MITHDRLSAGHQPVYAVRLDVRLEVEHDAQQMKKCLVMNDDHAITGVELDSPHDLL